MRTDSLVMKVLPFFWCQLFLGYILQSFTFEKQVLCLESPKNRKKDVPSVQSLQSSFPFCLTCLGAVCRTYSLNLIANVAELTKTTWGCNGDTCSTAQSYDLLVSLLAANVLCSCWKPGKRRETFLCYVFKKEKQTWCEVHVLHLWLSHKRVRLLCHSAEKPSMNTLP